MKFFGDNSARNREGALFLFYEKRVFSESPDFRSELDRLRSDFLRNPLPGQLDHRLPVSHDPPFQSGSHSSSSYPVYSEPSYGPNEESPEPVRNISYPVFPDSVPIQSILYDSVQHNYITKNSNNLVMKLRHVNNKRLKEILSFKDEFYLITKERSFLVHWDEGQKDFYTHEGRAKIYDETLLVEKGFFEFNEKDIGYTRSLLGGTFDSGTGNTSRPFNVEMSVFPQVYNCDEVFFRQNDIIPPCDDKEIQSFTDVMNLFGGGFYPSSSTGQYSNPNERSNTTFLNTKVVTVSGLQLLMKKLIEMNNGKELNVILTGGDEIGHSYWKNEGRKTPTSKFTHWEGEKVDIRTRNRAGELIDKFCKERRTGFFDLGDFQFHFLRHGGNDSDHFDIGISLKPECLKLKSFYRMAEASIHSLKMRRAPQAKINEVKRRIALLLLQDNITQFSRAQVQTYIETLVKQS